MHKMMGIGNLGGVDPSPSRQRRSFCKAIGMIMLARSLVGQRVALSEPRRSLIMLDGLLYRGKPDLRSLGFVPIAGSGDLWRPGVSHENVDEVRIRSLFEPLRASSEYYYIDIENWPLQSVSDDTRQRNVDKLTRVIELARSTAPNLRLGLYGLLPGITYWPLLRHDDEYGDWLKINRVLDPLAKHVDAVFPSLYTFYDDPEGWKSYARQTLIEARRYGKPVYPFLWPEFHDSNSELRGRELPSALWRAELELCADMADGMVLWGGWQLPWIESASWWRETLAFLKEHDDADHARR